VNIVVKELQLETQSGLCSLDCAGDLHGVLYGFAFATDICAYSYTIPDAGAQGARRLHAQRT
jgi:hypothetical protein